MPVTAVETDASVVKEDCPAAMTSRATSSIQTLRMQILGQLLAFLIFVIYQSYLGFSVIGDVTIAVHVYDESCFRTLELSSCWTDCH